MGGGGLPGGGASSLVSGPGAGSAAGVSTGSLPRHSTGVARPRGRAQNLPTPRSRLASRQLPTLRACRQRGAQLATSKWALGPGSQPGGSERGSEGGLGVRVPGPQQPAGDTQAPLQLPLSLGAGVPGIPQLGHQPGGGGAPAAQHPGRPSAAPPPAPLPPSARVSPARAARGQHVDRRGSSGFAASGKSGPFRARRPPPSGRATQSRAQGSGPASRPRPRRSGSRVHAPAAPAATPAWTWARGSQRVLRWCTDIWFGRLGRWRHL